MASGFALTPVRRVGWRPHTCVLKAISSLNAVQIVSSSRRKPRDIEHIGSAGSRTELQPSKATAPAASCRRAGPLDPSLTASQLMVLMRVLSSWSSARSTCVRRSQCRGIGFRLRRSSRVCIFITCFEATRRGSALRISAAHTSWRAAGVEPSTMSAVVCTVSSAEGCGCTFVPRVAG